MKKSVFFLAALMSMMMQTVSTFASDRIITKEQLPAAAQTFIQKTFPKQAISYAKIDFDGRKTVYPLTMMEQLDLAYAITVHKSQGSEFEVVIMPLLGRLEKLTYRNLFYTAVTRARKLLIVIGTPQKVQHMVESVHRNFRYSCLKYMLGKELDSLASEREEDS